jgi:hypothetical protein
MFNHTINYLNSTDFKDLLEKVSFAATVILAFAAVCGLRQLTLFKKDIILRNTRAAKERAIQCAERYAEYSELTGEYLKERGKIGLKSYDGPIGDFLKTSIPDKLMPDCVKRFSIQSHLAPMNLLEIIAANFTSGVADEETGYNIFGPSFCAAVESNYDLIAMWKKDPTDKSWSDIIELYRIWSPRMTRNALDLKRQEIELQMQSLPNRKITSIGCE